ncbi:diguanylate cyclase [Egicoccus sp. AB-alg6-2]|uniref:GGDEF domain-containing protein n=1 Tax=Egicoccus sp. AB-alg6-2 TaxID=3242692 RepID=UPI00359CE696
MSLTRTPRRARQDRGLVGDLRVTFHLVMAGVVAVIVAMSVLAGVLLFELHPDLRHDTEVTRSMRVAHDGMVAQESGYSGWLATGDADYLLLAEQGHATVEATSNELADLLGREPSIDRAILDLRLAQQAWIDQWVARVRALPSPPSDEAVRQRLLDDGAALFLRYRDVHLRAIDVAVGERDAALELERRALVTGFAAALALAGLVALLARRSSRRLAAAVAGPIDELLDGMERLAAGHAPGVSGIDGPSELRALGQGLENASMRLHQDRAALLLAQDRTERSAMILRSILDVAREIAGSLNVRYVAETLAEAANRIAGVNRVVVWLSDGSALIALHDSSRHRGAAPQLAPITIGDGGVGLAARDARPALVSGDHPGWAFPLVVGGRVVGVLELTDAASDDIEELIEPLETLAIHGGAALEAARLHHQSQELAQVDALTQLLNRRRLDADLQVELERSKRYGRPLAFVMLDIDHFKQLNDNYGHLHGDEVLRMVAESLVEMVRGSDTVYRYGGEEFAVLVREGGEEDAALLAERLRVGLERVFAGSQGFAKVTASFGVAAVPLEGCAAEALVGTADRALYAAKRGGRNRVEVGRIGTATDADATVPMVGATAP